MTNTALEFKVGDKVKYKDAIEARLNNHNPDMIYTIDEIIFNYCGYGAPAVSFHGSISKPWLSQLQLAEQPQKHIHHDLIVAWAKDPKGCVIQWRNPAWRSSWSDCNANKPGWDDKLEYRIKPRTKEVQRWKWVFKVADGYEVTNAYYTEDEAKNHFDNPLLKIEDSKVTAIEEV